MLMIIPSIVKVSTKLSFQCLVPMLKKSYVIKVRKWDANLHKHYDIHRVRWNLDRYQAFFGL